MTWSSHYGPILQVELKQQDIIHQVKGSQEEIPTFLQYAFGFRWLIL